MFSNSPSVSEHLIYDAVYISSSAMQMPIDDTWWIPSVQLSVRALYELRLRRECTTFEGVWNGTAVRASRFRVYIYTHPLLSAETRTFTVAESSHLPRERDDAMAALAEHLDLPRS